MKTIKTYLWGLFALLGITSLVANLITAMTFIYPWITRHYRLDLITGLDHDTLLYNYTIVVQYLLFPWRTTLYTPDFAMSDSGAFHFWEVRVIFLVMQAIAFLFIIAFVWQVRQKRPLVGMLNASANLTFLLFGLTALGMAIDFDWMFYWFHRLFFNNDYWIFNPRYDPIILAMPYQLFLIMGAIIIGSLFLIAGIFKYLNHRHKRA